MSSPGSSGMRGRRPSPARAWLVEVAGSRIATRCATGSRRRGRRGSRGVFSAAGISGRAPALVTTGASSSLAIRHPELPEPAVRRTPGRSLAARRACPAAASGSEPSAGRPEPAAGCRWRPLPAACCRPARAVQAHGRPARTADRRAGPRGSMVRRSPRSRMKLPGPAGSKKVRARSGMLPAGCDKRWSGQEPTARLHARAPEAGCAHRLGRIRPWMWCSAPRGVRDSVRFVRRREWLTAPRGVSSMVEQRTFNPWVLGSSPRRPTL